MEYFILLKTELCSKLTDFVSFIVSLTVVFITGTLYTIPRFKAHFWENVIQCFVVRALFYSCCFPISFLCFRWPKSKLALAELPVPINYSDRFVASGRSPHCIKFSLRGRRRPRVRISQVTDLVTSYIVPVQSGIRFQFCARSRVFHGKNQFA